MAKNKRQNKESIIELINGGFSDTEIAEILRISTQSGYIRKIRRELNNPNTNNEQSGTEPDKLTPEIYFNAIMNHNGTKEELANKLRVSRMTLHNFERKTDILYKISRYLKIQGYSVQHIAKKLGVKQSTLLDFNLDRLPNIPTLKIQLDLLLDTLQDVAQWNEQITPLYYQWKSIAERLK